MVKAVVLKKAVIVAGHPRSGTSLACQLVESGGVTFPSDFEGDEYNREGYYELSASKELSKRLMEEAMTEKNTEHMNRLVRQLNRVQGWSGLKLVRVPALFFYRHLTDHLKSVLVFRHPANVQASLFKRGIAEFPVPWSKNCNALIAAYENIEDSIVVGYDSLLSRQPWLRQGFSRIGLDVDMDVIDPAQRTQQNSRVYVSNDDLQIYERLKELEKESCGAP